MALTRRHFCSIAATALSSRIALPQSDLASSRPDVAAIDQARIFAAADQALHDPVETLTQHPSAPAPAGANDFAAEGEPAADSAAGVARAGALLRFTIAVPALVAAAVLLQSHGDTKADACTRKAADWLDAWLVSAATRMTPTLAYARLSVQSHTPLPEGVADAAALAEIAKAIPFLASFNGITPERIAAWKSWFTKLADWLDTARLAGLARDSKDHTGSAWLLLRTAIAVLLADDAALTALRHRFRTITIRAQILAEGIFPHELTTENPYRNSLFNLDQLAASADLLSTRFESAWSYELQDGPGMRGAIARHVPWIRTRGSWPYKADLRFFTALPCRRPALLFAARALQQADYAALWRTLNPDPTEPAILRSFPIRQPLLWTFRPRPAPL